jgi:excisionase family DNA binding protein
MTIEELRQLIATVRVPASPYLTVDEAAAYCRVAVQTIYNRRKEIERVPGVRRLLFKKETLDKWLATRRKRR